MKVKVVQKKDIGPNGAFYLSDPSVFKDTLPFYPQENLPPDTWVFVLVDEEKKALGCPFCGNIPEKERLLVVCRTDGCALEGIWITLDLWNKRFGMDEMREFCWTPLS
jgi:hypothetical protein